MCYKSELYSVCESLKSDEMIRAYNESRRTQYLCEGEGHSYSE